MTPIKVLSPGIGAKSVITSNPVIAKTNLTTIIDQVINQSVAFTPAYLERKIPNYPSPYYIEVTNNLSQIDSSSLDNFSSLVTMGEGAQQRINKLSSKLLELEQVENFFSTLKLSMYTKYFSFSLRSIFSKPAIDECYAEFTSTVNAQRSVYQRDLKLATEYQEQITSSITRLSFYELVFKLLTTELVERRMFTIDDIARSVIATRIISIKNSTIVAKQLHQLIEQKISTLQSELDNITNYLNVLKVALDILFYSNKDEFTSQFKRLLQS